MSEKEYLKNEVEKEKDYTWCKISNSGELLHFDWLYIKRKSDEFDKNIDQGIEDENVTMCKLVMLSRQQTVQKMIVFMERFLDYDNNTPAIVSYDPTKYNPPSPATFVFFHVGDDLTQPKRLVDSIRKTNAGADIVMCTDLKTPHIEGVTRRFEIEVNREYLMPSRWKAFYELNLESPAIYMDTDMVVLGSINLPALIGDRRFVFCFRSFDRMAPFDGEQRGLDFSEHHQKPLGIVYPVLACFTITKSGSEWKELYEKCASQPDKYQRWYGDQEVLREFVKSLKAHDFNYVEESKFACLPEYSVENSPFILHYTGDRKNFGLQDES
jgi:hypothetical protein